MSSFTHAHHREVVKVLCRMNVHQAPGALLAHAYLSFHCSKGLGVDGSLTLLALKSRGAMRKEGASDGSELFFLIFESLCNLRLQDLCVFDELADLQLCILVALGCLS